MTQLNDVLGALLRDIAQARVTSDIFSREISQLYEKDSLLRLFPVPRSEIREIELELKFAITKVAAGPVDTYERAAKVSVTFEQHAEKLTQAILEAMRASDTLLKTAEWLDLLAKLKTERLPFELRRSIQEYLETNSGSLVQVEQSSSGIDLMLATDQVVAAVEGLADRMIFDRSDVSAAALKHKSSLLTVRRHVSAAVGEQVASLAVAIGLVKAAEDNQLDVDVTVEKLASLPETALSVLRVKTEIRNYTWSQVEERDDVVVRKLVPE